MSCSPCMHLSIVDSWISALFQAFCNCAISQRIEMLPFVLSSKIREFIVIRQLNHNNGLVYACAFVPLFVALMKTVRAMCMHMGCYHRTIDATINFVLDSKKAIWWSIQEKYGIIVVCTNKWKPSCYGCGSCTLSNVYAVENFNE